MIRVVVGDLSLQETEGVLRPIRADLTPTTVGGRNVGDRAGEIMTQRLERMGTLPVGGAVITPGGTLGSAFVIHVVVASGDEPQTARLAELALRNGLRRATEWGLASLALPPLGLGVGMVEAEDVAHDLVQLLIDHLDEGQAPLDIAIVVSDAYEEGIFSRVVEQLTRERFPMQN
jgi:O-acetyl-ADP-ribose deacetylase (regulator of RNase III)